MTDIMVNTIICCNRIGARTKLKGGRVHVRHTKRSGRKESMTRKELEQFDSLLTISAENLINRKDRTLLYGYTCDRKTFHVYLKNMKIHVVNYVHRYAGETVIPVGMRERQVECNSDYVPDKRVYPAKSDYEFCGLLKLRGCRIPFTFYEDVEEVKDFYGFTMEDIAEN